MGAGSARRPAAASTRKVFPQNNNIAGSDPAALKALVAGDIQFFTLMGGILGTIVPAAEVQQMPFAFGRRRTRTRAMDGPLGAYLSRGDDRQGDTRVRGRARSTTGCARSRRHKRIVTPGDLAGLKMRVPAGQLVADTFKAFGCQPVVINSDSIHAALKDGRADAQENPLTLADQFKLYEVVTVRRDDDHMWSGFNLLAHCPTWQRLPEDSSAVIDRNVTSQRQPAAQDQIRGEHAAAHRAGRARRSIHDARRGTVQEETGCGLRQVEGAARLPLLESASVSYSSKWKVKVR